jgi:hypothetical protein
MTKDLKSLHDRQMGPPLDVISGILEQVSSFYESESICIDGLDECENRKDILTVLQSLRNNDRFNSLITSRPENDLIVAFQGLPQLEMDTLGVFHDIATHLDDRIYRHAEFDAFSESLKQVIRDTLLAQSRGM